MKSDKYFFIMLIFLVFMISISAASAADDAIGDTISTSIEDTVINSADEEISLDESDEDILKSDEEVTLYASDDEAPLSAEPLNFVSLNNKINEIEYQEYITLDSDYAYDSSTDGSFKNGIQINRKVTIDGQYHTISGSNLARIFYIDAAGVTIMNINFVNGSTDSNGGAIRWSGGNGQLKGNNFTNNTAGNTGGAVYWWANNGFITDNNFTNNRADKGGAVYLYIDYANIEGNIFTNNTARNNGGSILWNSEYCKVENSKFIGNKAERGDGGAIYFSGSNGMIINYDHQLKLHKQQRCKIWRSNIRRR